MSSTPPLNDDVRLLVEAFWCLEQKIMSKSPPTTSDVVFPRKVHLRHVAWKFNEFCNELWVDGVLGVVLSPKVKNPDGFESTKIHYSFDNGDNSTSHKELFYQIDHMELAKYHLLWLTEPNVYIDSATIDMEFESALISDKKQHFRVKKLNISVQSNFNSINGWLQCMDPNFPMKEFIFRGNGILDANKLLVYPFISGLQKLMIVYESSFDDRTVNLINATQIQLASDFITEVGVNRLIQRWNDEDYPIRSSFIIYMRVQNPESVVFNLEVLDSEEHADNGVTEFLVQMSTNEAKRMRIVVRSSSVVCTVFAIDNSLSE